MGGNKGVYGMCIDRPASSNVDLARSRIEKNDTGGSKAKLPPFFLPLTVSFISGALLPTCTSSIYTSHTELPLDQYLLCTYWKGKMGLWQVGSRNVAQEVNLRPSGNPEVPDSPFYKRMESRLVYNVELFTCVDGYHQRKFREIPSQMQGPPEQKPWSLKSEGSVTSTKRLIGVAQVSGQHLSSVYE